MLTAPQAFSSFTCYISFVPLSKWQWGVEYDGSQLVHSCAWLCFALCILANLFPDTFRGMQLFLIVSVTVETSGFSEGVLAHLLMFQTPFCGALSCGLESRRVQNWKSKYILLCLLFPDPQRYLQWRNQPWNTGTLHWSLRLATLCQTATGCPQTGGWPLTSELLTPDLPLSVLWASGNSYLVNSRL